MTSVKISIVACTSSSLFLEKFPSSTKMLRNRFFPALAPANKTGRLFATVAVSTNQDNRKSTQQDSLSEHGSWPTLLFQQHKRIMAKTFTGIICGVVACTSVAWDLPAFAEVPTSTSTITPYSKAADRIQVGLVKGRIRPCPLDVNPNCVSTSSNNRGYGAPWIIPESSTSKAAKKIETAILSTQRNPAIIHVEETPDGGTYLVAEADGFLGRDLMEFLVRNDVVTYRSMAKKVVYVYPFTTPIGDFDGQQKHLRTLEDELGWGVPIFENTYDEETE